ncbi:MAG: hypothetical protein ABSB19_07925 [Methylomonas sp.]|jgi:nucleoside phosphorylase
MPPSLYIFTALECEAKPLIRRWELKKLPNPHAFSIYSNNDRILVITGIGQIAMAAGVGYSMALFPNREFPLMLNIGVAGHQQLPIGALVLADKIVNRETGKNYYPQLGLAGTVNTATVTTVTSPQTDYKGETLYDMEAAAFFEVSCKFSCSELIHSLKIVSDNADSSLENINADAVTGWINAQIPGIDALINRLMDSKKYLPQKKDDLYALLSSQFHFSASNAAKLTNLLQRWKTLNPDSELEWRSFQARSGEELLKYLEKQLDKSDFYL